MSEIAFDNMTKPTAISSSKNGASALAMFKPSESVDNLFFKGYNFEEWDPAKINSYLELMTPQACYFILQAKENAQRPD